MADPLAAKKKTTVRGGIGLFEGCLLVRFGRDANGRGGRCRFFWLDSQISGLRFRFGFWTFRWNSAVFYPLEAKSLLFTI
nr:MAG TPA: hypothetical protein [Caudoviricetes sp.]